MISIEDIKSIQKKCSSVCREFIGQLQQSENYQFIFKTFLNSVIKICR